MKKRTRRILIALACIIAVGAVGAWAFYEAMSRAWIRINEYDIRSEGLLQVGDLAPDLELASIDGTGWQRLSELHREKPLVLVFGSYT